MQLMKRSFNKLVFGALIAIVAAMGAINAAAQDPQDEKTTLYNKFGQCYKSLDVPTVTACIATGEEYMTKFGTPPDPYSEFVGKKVASMKDFLAKKPLLDAYAKLDNGIKAQNWKDVFDGGREAIRLETNDSKKLDLNIFMAELGYSRAFATPPDATYTAEAINYAKTAIHMMDSGVMSQPRPGPNNTQVDA